MRTQIDVINFQREYAGIGFMNVHLISSHKRTRQNRCTLSSGSCLQVLPLILLCGKTRNLPWSYNLTSQSIPEPGNIYMFSLHHCTNVMPIKALSASSHSLHLLLKTAGASFISLPLVATQVDATLCSWSSQANHTVRSVIARNGVPTPFPKERRK